MHIRGFENCAIGLGLDSGFRKRRENVTRLGLKAQALTPGAHGGEAGNESNTPLDYWITHKHKNVFSVFYSCSFHISFRFNFRIFDNLLFCPYSWYFISRECWKRTLTAARDFSQELQYMRNGNILIIFFPRRKSVEEAILHKFHSRQCSFGSLNLLLLTVLCVFLHSSILYNSLHSILRKRRCIWKISSSFWFVLIYLCVSLGYFINLSWIFIPMQKWL